MLARYCVAAFLTGTSIDLELIPTATPRQLTRNQVVSPPKAADRDRQDHDIIARVCYVKVEDVSCSHFCKQNAIAAVRERIRVSGANVYTFFQDFGYFYGNSQMVTPEQFARIIVGLDIVLEPIAVSVLQDKFATPSGQFDFRAFVAAVDARECTVSIQSFCSCPFTEAQLQQTDQLFYSNLPEALLLTQRYRDAQSQVPIVQPAEDVLEVITKIQLQFDMTARP